MGVREDFFRAVRNFARSYHMYLMDIDELSLALWVEEGSVDAGILDEAQHKGKPIGGPYSARLDPSRGPNQMADLHVFMGNRQLFAVYSDGTRKHGKPGFRIPNKVVKGINKHFPGIMLPADQILEMAQLIGVPVLED